MQKTTLFRTAVILQFVVSLYSVIGAFPALMNGPEAPGPTQGIPQVVIVLASFLGIVGIISAYGAWHGRKWGIWVSIVVRALDGILALPGVLAAPTAALRVAATLGIVIAMFVIVGLLFGTPPPTTRRVNG